MKKKSKKVKQKGRSTKYKPEYAERGYKQALLGLTDAELAEYFNVAESTLHLWKKKHIAFKEALISGKSEADGLVAQSMFKRATGFTTKEKHFENASLKKIVEKEVPGDVGAQMNWLKNRQPKKWRDKVEQEITVKQDQVFKIGDQIMKF